MSNKHQKWFLFCISFKLKTNLSQSVRLASSFKRPLQAFWMRSTSFHCNSGTGQHVLLSHHYHHHHQLQGVPKNALSELPFCETGFGGTWPSTASWAANWQKGNSESAFFLGHPVNITLSTPEENPGWASSCWTEGVFIVLSGGCWEVDIGRGVGPAGLGGSSSSSSCSCWPDSSGVGGVTCRRSLPIDFRQGL